MQKTQGDIRQVLSATSVSDSGRESDVGSTVIHEDGTVVRSSMDDRASTRGIIAPSPTTPSYANANDDEPVSAVPTIRISTESSRGDDDKEEDKTANHSKSEDNDEEEEEGKDELEESVSASEDTVDRKKEKGKAKEVYVDEEKGQDVPIANGAIQQNGVRKPVQAAGEGDQNVNEASPAPAQEPFSFSNKRLCERWLDNLFMVLYEVGCPFLLCHTFNNKFI